MSAKQFNEMVNCQSGLLDREMKDVREAEAVALFCYQVKKWIGAFAAALSDWTNWCSLAAPERTPHGPCQDFRGAGIPWSRNRRKAKCGTCGRDFRGG